MPFKSYSAKEAFLVAVKDAGERLGCGVTFFRGEPVCAIGHAVAARGFRRQSSVGTKGECEVLVREYGLTGNEASAIVSANDNAPEEQRMERVLRFVESIPVAP